MSGYESIMVEALARLQAPTPLVPGAYGVRRSHKTIISVDQAPGAHVIDGKHRPDSGSRCGGRNGEFSVAIFTRGDAAGLPDPYVIELYRRMSAPWPEGVVIGPGEVETDTEIADGDAERVLCQFTCHFGTDGEWGL